MPKAVDDLLWKRIQANPTLYSQALCQDDRHLNWHSFAASANSSQAFCFSALGTLRNFEPAIRNKILAALAGRFFLDMGTAGRSRAWSLKCEVENPQLLGEFGSNQPTSIDALLTSSTEVITVESKFDRDAKEGLGTCSQFKKGLCEGYFGPGSDNSLSGDTPWCRLERWDGSRSPRYYWALGKSFFRPEIFRMQHLGEQCPFSDGNYQLMRNFLFAAAFAEIQHKNRFGVLVICPSSRSNLLIDQVECFKKKILLKSYADRVAICTYETYIDILRQQKSSEAHQLADFLVERISSILKG